MFSETFSKMPYKQKFFSPQIFPTPKVHVCLGQGYNGAAHDLVHGKILLRKEA